MDQPYSKETSQLCGARKKEKCRRINSITGINLIIQGSYDGFLVWELGNSVFFVKTMGATPRPALFVGNVIVDYGSMGNSVKIEMQVGTVYQRERWLKISALVGR